MKTYKHFEKGSGDALVQCGHIGSQLFVYERMHNFSFDFMRGEDFSALEPVVLWALLGH